MRFMASLIPSAATLALVTFGAAPAGAQDGVHAELKALRQLIELQSKQIEVLSAQVTRLTSQLEGRAEPGSAGTVTSGVVQPAETTEFAVPAARVVAAAQPANTHIVVKGESLDKIAKTHGTTVPELQRLNRISDPKKLQIGQQLLLPPTTPKKENQ